MCRWCRTEERRTKSSTFTASPSAASALPGVDHGCRHARSVAGRQRGLVPACRLRETATSRQGRSSALFRVISPGFFSSLGVPIITGRDFNDDDQSGEPVVIISQTRRSAVPGPGSDQSAHYVDRSGHEVYLHRYGPRRIVGDCGRMDETIGCPEADDDLPSVRVRYLYVSAGKDVSLFGGRCSCTRGWIHTP